MFQKRVLDTFPKPIDAWAKNEAHKALKTKKKSVLVLPFDKVHSLLKEVLHSNRLDDQVSLYLVAVLDYIAGDILKVWIIQTNFLKILDETNFNHGAGA